MFSAAYLKLITFLHLLYKNTLSLLFSVASPNCGCRFYPPCSDYFIQASKSYGPLTGMHMGIKRLLRCNGLNAGGYDPVSETLSQSQAISQVQRSQVQSRRSKLSGKIIRQKYNLTTTGN